MAYDGVEPEDLEGEDRELAKRMFGDVDAIPEMAREHIFLLCGGRAGKTYVLGALRLVWGAYVRDLSSLAPGQRAVALSVAPKDVHRQEIINYQLGVIRSKPELKATIIGPRYLKDDDAPEGFDIKRPDGQIVTFEGGTSNRGGYGGRGRSLTDCLMDEAAFFQDAKNVVNDKDIFKAASPRVLPGGQMIAPSTAWAKLGYHYDRWKENHGHPVNAIAVHATTELLRPAAAPMVRRERATDPDNARREFDAIPMGDAPLVFFGDDLIELCIDNELTFPIAPESYDSADPEMKTAGGDFGFRSNSSALAIGHKKKRQIRLANLQERRPEEGRPLKPSVTIKDFAAICAEHGVHQVMADGHYREAVAEHMGVIALVDAPAPDDVCVRARTLMRDGRVRFARPDSLQEPERSLMQRFIKQLREVRGAPRAGGGYSIAFPLWPDGSHGDLAAAFVLMLWQFGGETSEAVAPAVGSEEWEAQERAKRRLQKRK